MAETIKIKRGLSLKLKGEAPTTFLNPSSDGSLFALVPDDFTGVVPKMLVRVGDKVKAGDAVFCHKKHPQVTFVSPISGEITAIERGAKRKILSVQITKDAQVDVAGMFKHYEPLDVVASSGDAIKKLMLESGMWAFIRQRPYDIIAEPEYTPRDIFVTAHFTAPLAPHFNFILEQGRNKEFLAIALQALAKLTAGRVYIGVETPLNLNLNGVIEVVTEGPHPAGSNGVLINYTKPINKGEVVWTLKATDLLVIGRFLATGVPDFSRIIAVTGSEASQRGYINNVVPGCDLAKTIANTIPQTEKHLRLINGDVLTGIKIDAIRPYASWDIDQTTLIPEGDEIREFVGWIMPRFNQFSISRTYFSWLTKNKRYQLDARLKGGERHMIMSDEFPKVFPLNIIPEALLKSIIAFNIDKMEDLGIYEVAPEDFALCEFVDSSKQELQQIVRHGLDMLYKEMN